MEDMERRPTSVTVIAWYLIVTAGVSAVSSAYTFTDPLTRELMNEVPLPIPVQYAQLGVGLLIQLVSGIAMLKGRNWARLLYVGYGVFGILVGAATIPWKLMMIPGILVLAIVAFFLFRPKANEYFSPTAESGNA